MKLSKSKSTDGKGLISHYKGLDKAKKHITIGIQPDAQDYADGTSILTVAVAGEYGNARLRIKPRYFLSRSVSKDHAFYQARIRKLLKAYRKGAATFLNVGLSELGRQGVAKVRENIETNSIGMAGNSPNTIQAKGGDQPMVDSGHLVRQIDFRLEGGK